MQTTTATKATETHNPKCAAMGAHLPEEMRICRCATIAKADAEIVAAHGDRILFVGPVGKTNPRKGEPTRSIYETVKRLF